MLHTIMSQINPSLQQSVEQNHEAARRNAEQAGQFLNLVDDERSGEKPQALAKELRDDVYRYGLRWGLCCLTVVHNFCGKPAVPTS